MKNTNLKGRVSSKKGSVLFIVLVVMSFLVLISTAVFYTVSASKQNIVMTYNDMQAFQTANDVLSSVETLLFNKSNNTADGTDRLYSAIFGLRIACNPNTLPFPTCPGTVRNAVTGAITVSGTPCNGPNSCAIGTWARFPDANLEAMMTGTGRLRAGAHFLTSTPVHIRGSGDAEILIYVNRYGDIVLQVSVEYDGRRVTSQRIYENSDLKEFVPVWANPNGTVGEGVGWQWWIGDLDIPEEFRDGTSWHIVTSANHPLVNRNGYQQTQEAFDNGDTIRARQMTSPFCLGADNTWYLWTGDQGGSLTPTSSSPPETGHTCPCPCGLTASTRIYWRPVEAADAIINANLKISPAVNPTRVDWIGSTQPLYNELQRCFGTCGSTPSGSAGLPWFTVCPVAGAGNHAVGVTWETNQICAACCDGRCAITVTPGPPRPPTCGNTAPTLLLSATGTQGRCGRPVVNVGGANVVVDGVTYVAPPARFELTVASGRIGQSVWFDPGNAVCSTWNSQNPCWRPPHNTCGTRSTTVGNTAGNCNSHTTQGPATIGSINPGPNDGGVSVTVAGEVCATWLPNQTPCWRPSVPRCPVVRGTANNSSGSGVCNQPIISRTSNVTITSLNGNRSHTITATIAAPVRICSTWQSNTTHANGPCWRPANTTPVNGGVDTNTGHITFQGPGHQWTQGAAIHIRKPAGQNRAYYSRIVARGISAPIYHDADWAILGTPNKRDSRIEADITTTGNMVWGSNGLYGTSSRTLVITVGGDLHVGGGTGIPDDIAAILGGQHANGNTTGNVIVLVRGNVYMGQESGKYVNSNVQVYSVAGGDGNVEVEIRGTTQTVTNWINSRINVADNMGTWTIANSIWDNATVRNLNWNGSKVSQANATTLNTRYGITLPSSVIGTSNSSDTNSKENLFYISDNTILNPPTGPAMSGSTNIIIVDTGTDASNVVYVGLSGGGATNGATFRDGTGTFRWKPDGDNTKRISVLTIGNGSAVFFVPNNVTYGDTGGSYVGPFNLAVDPTLAIGSDTSWFNSDHGGGNRLGRFSYAVNRQTDAAWLRGLLVSTGANAGLGVLSANIPADQIAPRNHTPSLNMNVFLVHNGTTGLTLHSRNFFAGSVYAPNSTVRATSGDGDNLLLFGSIAARSIDAEVMDHMIAMLPGGGAGVVAPPTMPPDPGNSSPSGGSNNGSTPGTIDGGSDPPISTPALPGIDSQPNRPPGGVPPILAQPPTGGRELDTQSTIGWGKR